MLFLISKRFQPYFISKFSSMRRHPLGWIKLNADLKIYIFQICFLRPDLQTLGPTPLAGRRGRPPTGPPPPPLSSPVPCYTHANCAPLVGTGSRPVPSAEPPPPLHHMPRHRGRAFSSHTHAAPHPYSPSTWLKEATGAPLLPFPLLCISLGSEASCRLPSPPMSPFH
jgi:hypothetical protein